MSANINSMMAVGQVPWHGLGTILNNEVTSAEALIHAGLDWTVSKTPVQYHDRVKGLRTMKDQYVVKRNDNHAGLGVVGRVYTPLQNVEAFKFFDAVVGEKAAMYHTAGALGDGERVWILAKLPGYIRIKGGEDVTEKFLLLSNSHDGSGSVKVLFTPIRVVCQNTLNIALGSADKAHVAKLKHSGSIGLRVLDVREQIGLINEQFGIFEESAQAMASKNLTVSEFNKFLIDAGIAHKSGKHETTRAQNIMLEVSKLFDGGQAGAKLDGVNGTAWGAFNAVTQYVDWDRSTRAKDGEDNAQNRATSLLFGSGAAMKQKAWNAAMNLVTA